MIRRRTGGLSFRQKKKFITPSLIREIISWAVYSVIAVFIAFVLVLAFGMRVAVIGGSMEPTLYGGSDVLVDRLVYKLVRPERGDVVIFFPNGNERSHYYVKRVAAIPGDSVQIKDGRLYVNDVPSDIPVHRIEDAGMAENRLVMGSDEYFVLGDSPENGEDSRSANLGPVDRSLIVGKAWFSLGEESGWIR